MSVTGVFRDDAMLQQITELVNIKNTLTDELLNTKAEWNYVSVSRAVITSICLQSFSVVSVTVRL